MTAKAKKKPKPAKKAKRRPPRLEQQFLPGQEPVKNERVHRLAKVYADRRDERIAANAEEAEAHANLLAAMLEEKLEVYEYGEMRVVVSASRKCKVEFIKPTSTEPHANGEAKESE